MAFGARNDEGWRLCHRKGKSIYFVNEAKWPDVIIEFKSQAKAKACADELNEQWDAYWKKERKEIKISPTDPVFRFFLDTLLKHDGIARTDYDTIVREGESLCLF